MYGYNPGYGRPGPRMHLCPGCGCQVPFGMACGGCYAPWDPTTFLLMEMEAEIVEEVVEEVFFDDGFGGGDVYYDDGGGGW